MGLVLSTDCLLRWKSSCDSRYPCFFQMVTCIIAYEGPILSWIFGRFGWVWIYVSVGVYVFVFFGIFFNILHLTEPWNLNEQRLPKKNGLISSCSIPKHLLHALDIKETWQNTSLDARFLVSVDVFNGWHVFFPGPSVATDLRTIGGWGLVLDFHILESYGPTKMPSTPWSVWVEQGIPELSNKDLNVFRPRCFVAAS